MKNFLFKLKKFFYGDKSISECIVYTFVFFIFAAFALSYVLVLIWSFIAGARTHESVVLYPFENIFSNLNFSQYGEVFSSFSIGKYKFINMFLNSLYFSVIGVAFTILSTSTFAYVTTKYKFPCSGIFYYIVLFTMVLPLFGTGGSLYRLYMKLGFINSPLLVLTSLGGMNGLYLYFHAFYKSFSNTYMEAAELDGANDWQIFFKVVFPQSMGIVGALFLTQWVGAWNSYGDNLIYLPKMPTLASGLYLFNADMVYNARMDILFGVCFLVSIPPIILFVTFNKVLTSNISLGGIKE